jgi:uncharacterized protein YbcV (DUF1398 family)
MGRLVFLSITMRDFDIVFFFIQDAAIKTVYNHVNFLFKIWLVHQVPLWSGVGARLSLTVVANSAAVDANLTATASTSTSFCAFAKNSVEDGIWSWLLGGGDRH